MARPAPRHQPRIGSDELDAVQPSKTVCTRIEVLASQGSAVAADHTAAFVHDSSSPSNFYKCKYNLDGGLNMDRGGFGQSVAGTNFGCVFDGVTAGGKVNAYAAQAFSEYTLQMLHALHAEARLRPVGLAQAAAGDIFQNAARPVNNPGRQNQAYDAEGGSATGVYVMFDGDRRRPAKCILRGAALGDAVAIVLFRADNRAQMLNVVRRRAGSARDSGGQVTMSMGVDGAVDLFSATLGAGDLVILTTDGLTDNLLMDELADLVPLIARARFFDARHAPGMVGCTTTVGPTAHLPSLAELQIVVAAAGLDDLMGLSPHTIAKRIVHYVLWLTAVIHAQEQSYYALDFRRLELRRSPDPAQLAEVEALDIKLRAMADLRKCTGMIGKTDDVMVLVLSPFHTHDLAGDHSPLARRAFQAAGRVLQATVGALHSHITAPSPPLAPVSGAAAVDMAPFLLAATGTVSAVGQPSDSAVVVNVPVAATDATPTATSTV